MIALVVVLPLLLGILAVALFRDASMLRYIAIGAGALSLLSVFLVGYGITTVPWFSVGGHTIDVTVSVTPLNMMLLSLVLVIGLLVLVYSSGYIKTMSDQRRFYVEMLAFEAAMATFAVSGNFVLLFIAWEFLSLTSYLLIGFINSRPSANRAARKALTIIFIGDLALLASIAVFWNAFGTLEFAQIIASAGSAAPQALYAGTLLLLAAVLTKSAQFPFHEWLIDAMEGPTPVSAYLHSSTMVKAGVFTVILLYPLFSVPAISVILFAASVITLVLSTLAASREMHIKKVIAYSTIQELSIMMLAISVGAVMAAIFFFFVQAFYKALLFFSSGVVMEATGKENLDEVYGLKTRRLIYVSTLFGVLSLAGFFPLSGFFANEALSGSLLHSGPLYLLMSGISLLTSFYIIRWFSYLSRSRKGSAVSNGNYLSMPVSMVYPIAVLAALTLAASVLFFSMEGLLSGAGLLAYLPIQSGLPLSIADSVIFTILISVGALLGYLVYYKNLTKVSAKRFDRMLHTGPLVNWLYGMVAMLTAGFAAGLSEFDSRLNDAFDRVGIAVMASGYQLRKLSVGSINSYAVIFIVGLLVLFVSFYYLVII